MSRAVVVQPAKRRKKNLAPTPNATDLFDRHSPRLWRQKTFERVDSDRNSCQPKRKSHAQTKQGTKKAGPGAPPSRRPPRSDRAISRRKNWQLLSDTPRWNDIQHVPAATAPSPIVIGVPTGGQVRLRSETTLRGPSQILGHWYFSSNKKEGRKEEKQKRKRNERFRSVVIIISPSRPHDVSNTKTGGNGGAAFRRRIPWAQSEPDDRGGPIDASEGGSVPAGCGGIGPFPLVRRQPMDSTTRPTENERTHELASWCWLLLVVRSCDGKKEK